MSQIIKDTTDDALIQEYLNKGGKITKGETKPPKPEWACPRAVGGRC